ncbi:FAD/NAD(P)-binding protein [Azospirillum argentinense]|uniref:Hydroxyacylglutathione hydrolase n=1 Tax=Azospirillum argentinense TaxID=2970906 RepID=A0A2K1G5B2_9PROT|nr:FAD/NAD(P)-binding protein [Azospirillum argentinense]PNQ99859.1 hydroxyacylglutathione hydrolase [Azospirillum argentinense]
MSGLDPLRIVIVGAGVSGSGVAAGLVRAGAAGGFSAAVDLVDPRPSLGAGLTYAPGGDPRHRVNVPSVRMVAATGRTREEGAEEDFHRWCLERGVLEADPAGWSEGLHYPARSAFGRYLDERLRSLFAAPGPVRVTHRRNRAVAAHRRGTSHGTRFVVEMAGGTATEADALVLCTGNPPPELPGVLAALGGHPRVVADPWGPGALDGVAPDDRVLIVGTGLTMGDVVSTLLGRGHRGPLTALSRHGLVPRPRPAQATSWTDFTADPPTRVGDLLRRVRAAVAAARRAGRPWTDVLESLRLQNGALWSALPVDERRRFQRHLRVWWDVHRFQAAPQVARLVEAAQADGRLAVLAGRLVAASAGEGASGGDGLWVVHRPRGRDGLVGRGYDALVNCTGAGHGASFGRNPLLAGLAAQGLIRPDRLGLGIEVDGRGRALDAAGQPVPGLFVVGPPTRGSLGEVVGASEIVPHALAVAEALTDRRRRVGNAALVSWRS